MTASERIPLPHYRELPDAEMRERAERFNAEMQTRRTVRHFADRPVDRRIIEDCLRAAGSAPSGANQQPWQFVVVGDTAIKRRLRIAAEAEEREFYARRAPQDWLDALAPLGTDAEKPFLEIAPWLIAIFYKPYEPGPDGSRRKNYYPIDSTGIATGILITALHRCGLASLTHTPSPMGFLNEILGRPPHERPFLLLVTGHPAADATVPAIERKPLGQIATFL